jgi:pyruvate dehydrogenase E2 component (dihydrolipoamide acetyltransferase)
MAEPHVTSAFTGVKGEVRVEQPQRWEQAVVRRSAESRATVPDLELETEASVDATLRLSRETGATVSALALRACALALREVPRANGAYRDGSFELYSRVNVGLVVAAEETYAIPTVFDADEKSAIALTEEIERLSERARARELSPPELAGATFTFWPAGELGLTRASPLVVPPQAAAVAVGAVREAPILSGGEPAPAHALTITLGCDHRILYGIQAARFVNQIRMQLEEGTP